MRYLGQEIIIVKNGNLYDGFWNGEYIMSEPSARVLELEIKNLIIRNVDNK